jgi:hypothetical protein
MPDRFKICTKCKEPQPLERFYLKADGHYDSWCHPCRAEHARRIAKERPPLDMKPKNVRERLRRAQCGAFVLGYLKSHPCVDCGETDPIVLDFDHVRGEKRYAVTAMISHQFGLKTIAKEMEKCDIRCANCHRRKTALTQNWSRLRDYVAPAFK